MARVALQRGCGGIWRRQGFWSSLGRTSTLPSLSALLSPSVSHRVVRFSGEWGLRGMSTNASPDAAQKGKVENSGTAEGGGGEEGGGEKVRNTSEEESLAWMADFNMTPHADLEPDDLAVLGHRPMVYQLPLFNHPLRLPMIKSLTLEQRYKLLAPYGLPFFASDVLGGYRLICATKRNPLRLKIGVVVSKGKQEVRVVVRHMRYSSKYRYRFWEPRFFVAHDEWNLCRKGDVVVISHSDVFYQLAKSAVVVQNYGNKLVKEGTERADLMKQLINSVQYKPEIAVYKPADRSYQLAKLTMIRNIRKAKLPKKKLSRCRRMRRRANK